MTVSDFVRRIVAGALSDGRGRGLLPYVLSQCLFLSFAGDGHAQPDLAAAKLVEIRGGVEVLSPPPDAWRTATAGMGLAGGDAVRTANDGRASLLLSDESLIKLSRNSTFRLKQVARSAGWLRLAGGVARGASRYALEKGRLWLLNKNRSPDIEVETPTVTAAIRGTEVHIGVGPDGTSRVSVLEGVVFVANPFGSVNLLSGEEAIVVPGSAPVKQLIVEPENAAQWTLHIPPLFSSRNLTLTLTLGLEAAGGELRRAVEARNAGRAEAARDLFAGAAARDPASAPARVGLAWSLLDLDLPAAALDALGAAAAPGIDGALARALALAELGRLDGAAGALAEARRNAPGEPRLAALAAWLAILAGDITAADEAVSVLDGGAAGGRCPARC